MKKKNLTEVLEDIIYEYNVAYEELDANAIRRSIQILKERELDERWTVKDSEDFQKERNKK